MDRVSLGQALSVFAKSPPHVTSLPVITANDGFESSREFFHECEWSLRQ
ncbi:MAG: hypothetical protein RPR97_19720 [Colwellia sp.]